jgi:hypothetical protein
MDSLLAKTRSDSEARVQGLDRPRTAAECVLMEQFCAQQEVLVSMEAELVATQHHAATLLASRRAVEGRLEELVSSLKSTEQQHQREMRCLRAVLRERVGQARPDSESVTSAPQPTEVAGLANAESPQCVELRKQCEELRQELGRVREETSQRERDRLAQENRALKEMLERERAAHAAAESERSQQAASSTASQLRELRALVEGTRDQLAKVQRERDAAQDEATSLRAQLNAAQQALAAQREDVDARLRRMHAVCHETVQELSGHMQQLAVRCQEQEQAANDLRVHLEDAQAQVQATERDRADVVAFLRELQGVMDNQGLWDGSEHGSTSWASGDESEGVPGTPAGRQAEQVPRSESVRDRLRLFWSRTSGMLRDSSSGARAADQPSTDKEMSDRWSEQDAVESDVESFLEKERERTRNYERRMNGYVDDLRSRLLAS